MSTPKVVHTTVLVADDDALVRGVVRMALAREGYAVVEAGDAAAVIASAEAHHPALVVLDINMPGGSVTTTLAALRALNPELAVLVLSGESHEPLDLIEHHGEFARKPIELDDLLRRVRRLLAQEQV